MFDNNNSKYSDQLKVLISLWRIAIGIQTNQSTRGIESVDLQGYLVDLGIV